MRTNDPYKVRVKNINSLKDLEREKERLQLEIVRREERIRHTYHNLVHLLSFRNLAGALVEELTTTATVAGKLVTFGRDIFAKRKKKKKAKLEAKAAAQAAAVDAAAPAENPPAAEQV